MSKIIEVNIGINIDLEKSAEENINHIITEAKNRNLTDFGFNITIVRTLAKIVDYNIQRLNEVKNDKIEQIARGIK